MLDRGRQNLMLMATLRVGAKVAGRVRVRDISKGGLKVEASLAPDPGAAIEIELPNLGWLEGTVAWAKGCQFGIRLSTEIDPAAVRQPISGSYVRPSPDHRPDLRCVA